jgi:hypothetical protein
MSWQCTSAGGAPLAQWSHEAGRLQPPPGRVTPTCFPITLYSIVRMDGSPPHVFVTQWSRDAVPQRSKRSLNTRRVLTSDLLASVGQLGGK